MAKTKASPAASEPSDYRSAVAELDEILREIEGDAVDVDVLGTRVARASELIRWCRGRILSARAEVEAVTETDTGPETDPADPVDPVD